MRPLYAVAVYNVDDMDNEHATNKLFFSLIVPALTDREEFDVQIMNVCGVLDGKIPGCYEIVTIENRQDDDHLDDWDHVRGEVLVIIDGDLANSPTALVDVIEAFKEGSDMAFASQYIKSGTGGDPDLSYFGIKRSSLSRLHESPNGQKLILGILGPETIKKLSTAKGSHDSRILKNLRQLIKVRG